MTRSLEDYERRLLAVLKPEWVFVCLALTAGMCLAFVTGPFQNNDEITHFRRAYQLSQGQLISSRQGDSVGGYIPRTIATAHAPFSKVFYHPKVRIDTQALSEKLKEPLDAEKQCFSHFLMPAVYAPTLYIPQVIGIAIGRLCGLSALKIMYAGRVVNLLCWIAVIFFAIKTTPVFKWLFVLVPLLPMNLALAASLSADASTNAAALLLVAVLLRVAVADDGSLKEWHRALIMILCVFLSLAKQAYFPLTGLILLIPASRFGRLRDKIVFCGAIIGTSLAATLLWSSTAQGLFVTFVRGNAPEQMALLLENPWKFPKIMIDSIGMQWRSCAFAWIGLLGFMDTWLPKWIYWSYPFVLLFSVLLQKEHVPVLGWPQKIWIVCVIFAVFILIDLSLYLIWTPPGADTVHGVQGRYFLPLVIPALLIFSNQKFNRPNLTWAPLAAAGYSTAVLLATCVTVFARFYGPVS